MTDFSQEPRTVVLPIRTKLLDRVCERLVVIAHKDWGLVLRTIGMQFIPVAKAMGIVIPHDGHPVAAVLDFQLRSKAQHGPTRPKIRAANLGFTRSNSNQPSALHGLSTGHQATF